MKKISIGLLFVCASMFAQKKVSYVNPMIGTGGHGHTFPGAVLPFGMVQLSPDTRVDGSWDGCSGYHYSDSKIYGFSHTHLSGTGCTDWGDIMIMPYIGEPSISSAVYASQFSHTTEKTSAGYYEVMLEDDKIKAELTVTPRVGIHRYTFRKTADANIVLDLLHRDNVNSCSIFFPDSLTIVGSRLSGGWASNQKVYYAIKFSKAYYKRAIANNGKFIDRPGKFKIQPEQGVFTFDMSDGEPLLVKVAISSVSSDGALRNLNEEASHWDFEKYKNEASTTWEKQLSKIDIEETDEDKRTVFYTALYRACIHPSLNMDVDGQYRGRDDKVHKAEGFTNYSVFSLWDTYRALHPLMTIIEQKRTGDFIQSFLVQFQQGGRLPVWELSSNETDCMIGFHSASVIADAMQKGIRNFDTELAYKALKASASYTGFGLPIFNKQGYLEVDDEHESVSKSLEYCYDFWCVGQVASMLGKAQEADYYYKRSLGYRQLFDSATGFMRPRKNGNWLSPFYPNEINNHFTEGNSWQYSFYVPHDVNGLISLQGGTDKFESKLDELFTTSQKTRGREQADVTGLIGQYAHGNEPSHHMAFLYNYVGRYDKSTERVNKICKEFYKNSPDGLIGNEDCGQMSAWYIMAGLGMYPVCPGDGRYVLVQPQFKKASINLENGAVYSIASNPALNEIWKGLKVGDRELLRSEISHEVIMKGGNLQYMFAAAGAEKKLAPTGARVLVNAPLSAPLIVAPSQVFKTSQTITIVPMQRSGGNLLYSLEGKYWKGTVQPYTQPIVCDSSITVKAYVISGYDTSAVSIAKYYKLKNDYAITLVSKCNAQYEADGAQSLVDGIPLSTNWRKGNWLGVQTQNFECIIDRKLSTEFTSLALSCLQDSRSWILYPTGLKVFGSKDGKKFQLLGELQNAVNTLDYEVSVKDLVLNLPKASTFRYIKVLATQYGKLPQGHAGVGGDSFIFAGELNIR